MPHLGIFGLGFYKTIAIIEINTLQFLNSQNFAKKSP